MTQRTNLDWLNEINRLQGRGQIAQRFEKERELDQRIAELVKENKKLKNDLENKTRELKNKVRQAQSDKKSYK
jgi:uncharacterized protein YlxW (UPF0749 family)